MSSLIAVHDAPRLAPIEAPRSFWVRVLALGMRFQLGKVMTPLKVIYARMPRLVWPQMLMVRLAQKGLSLDPLLVHMVQTRVSLHNGCTFCVDLHQAVALRDGCAREKLSAILDLSLAEAGSLSHAERVAIAFVDQVTLHVRADDATWQALREAFDERRIVELTWLCAFTTYLNRLAVPLGIGSDGFCALLPPSAAD